MTPVGVVGIVIALSAIRVALVRRSEWSLAFFVLAFMLHVAASYAFYRVALTNASDSHLYYYDPYGMFAWGFGFNTQFIIWSVQSIKRAIGGSFLDYFLLFQAVGLFGIALLMRIFDEIHDEMQTTTPIWVYSLLLLPSLQYWSSSLGKDAPFLFASVLAIWGAMRIRRRYVAFAVGSFIMLLIRPHLALLALASLAVAVILDRRTSLLAKVALGTLAALGVAYAISATMQSLNIDLTSADVISDRMAAREQLLTSDDAGASVVSGSFLIRLFSLLARPLFFDAHDPLAMIASVENLGILLMLGLLLWRFRTTLSLFRNVAFVRYALANFLALTILLAFEYYNIGLGLRQKWTMIMPNLLVVFVALTAVLQADARQRLARAVHSGDKLKTKALAARPAGHQPWTSNDA
jgi:hypothetical protein